jgi:Tol biopolymer transport system component
MRMNRPRVGRYASTAEGATQVYVRWMDSGQTAKVTRVQKPPESLTWSPDGKWIAFAMFVPEEIKPFAELPAKPDGADWGKPPHVIQKVTFRHDGEGFVEDGYTHIFVVPAEGGTPRQLTRGSFQHAGYWSMERPSNPLAWSPDGQAILFSANRHEDWEYNPLNTEIYEVSVKEGAIHALTDRKGPDSSPALSPDGKRIAYVGFDDREQGYQVSRLYLMNRDGSNPHVLVRDLDRDVKDPTWSNDDAGIFFQYDDQGNTRVALASLDGTVRVLAKDLGGVSHGRPYEGGSFSVAYAGRFAYTQSQPSYPSDGRGPNRIGRSQTRDPLER